MSAAAQSVAPDKRLATLMARAALVGVTVHCFEGDFGGKIFIATKWALTKNFSGTYALEELEAWLDRVTGKPA